MVAESIKKCTEQYMCKVCDYQTYRKSSMNKHLLTSKHIDKISVNVKQIDEFLCKTCSKVYKKRNSLWYHEQKCINENIPTTIDASSNEIKTLTSLVLELVKSNNDLQKQMIDVCSKIQPSTINSNNTSNSHNKTFNLQFFLNEECKDAMNLNDFVESVQLQMTDLEKIGELGYIEGVSKFIMGKLNETDVNKRPVHCSDAKRETLYVKDDNVWTKEGEENSKIRGAVKKIEKKNIKLLNAWKETHAGCMDSDSPYNDQYTHMIIGSLGGCEPDNVNKVIKKIAKATIIDK
jgi:hypothetical protein